MKYIYIYAYKYVCVCVHTYAKNGANGVPIIFARKLVERRMFEFNDTGKYAFRLKLFYVFNNANTSVFDVVKEKKTGKKWLRN